MRFNLAKAFLLTSWRRYKQAIMALWLLLLPMWCLAKSEVISIASSLDDYDISIFLDEFKRKTGIDYEFVALDTADLKMELIIRADTQTLPDAVLVPGDLLGLEMVNFSEISPNWLNANLPQKALHHARVKERLLGIPIIAGNHLMLYYNKRLIKQPANSWKSLKAQQSVLPNGIDLIAWSYNEMFWLIPFLGAFEAFPYEDGKVNLNASGTANALNYYQNLATSGVVSTQCHYQCSFGKFVSGEVAYMINGSWALNGFSKALGDDLGITQLPTIQGKVMKPYSSVFALAFPGNSASSEKRAALKQLALFLQSEQIQRRFWDEYQFLPANSNIQQTIKAQNYNNISNLIQQLDNAEPLPTDPEMSIIWEALVMGFNRHQGGALDANQASEYMQYIAEKTRRELY